MDSAKSPTSDLSETGAESLEHANSHSGLVSRREFFSVAACAVAFAGMQKFVVAQNADHRPTPTDGPPPCEGICSVYPFILIPRGVNDKGSRSTDPNDRSLGVESPNVWVEDLQTGQPVANLTPGVDYQIVAEVANIGSGPTFTLSVDFMVWTKIDNANHTNVYSLISSSHGLALMQDDSKKVRSAKWTPAFGMGLKPGDIIVRAYDPWADHYSETGLYLYVNRDRHLAHKSYS
jgi:hypothetical protein